MKEKPRDFQDVRCPICGGEVNQCWFKDTVIEYEGDKENLYARFVCECWSGDLTKDTPHHIFRLDYLIDGKVTYPKTDDCVQLNEVDKK